MKKLGLVGRKIGMTRVYTEEGATIPITVIALAHSIITQLKTPDRDGYSAVQVASGRKKLNGVHKSIAGHYAKASAEMPRDVAEFCVEAADLAELRLGQALSVDLFQAGQLVDVTGQSKGKGFSGVIKRHNFSSNRASHGNSRSHNTPGSIGQAQDPGRVFPGKKMAGQYGNTKRTVQCLEVIRVDVPRQLLFVKGGVPGAINGRIIVRPSVKVNA